MSTGKTLLPIDVLPMTDRIWITFNRIGEEVAFAMQGKYGVVHGAVEQYFRPYHLMLETGNLEDLTENQLRLCVRTRIFF